MKWLCAVLMLIAAAIAAPSNADDVGAAPPTRILVTFSDPGVSNAARAGPVRPGYRRRSSTYLISVGVRRAANRIARDFDLRLVDEWPILPLNVHCIVFAVADDAAIDTLLARLRARREVESAQRLNQFDVSGSIDAVASDPYAGLQHTLDTLELAQAHAWSLGEGISVTIIDTGADFRHPELRTQIKDHHDFVTGNDSDFTADAHGTAVAGVIAAASNNGVGLIGVAPSARLSVLKACWYVSRGSGAVCDTFTLAKALVHAVESDADVINLSLGGPSDALLGRLVDLALKRGIVVVTAAPSHGSPGFPAELPGVIVVGSDHPLEGHPVFRASVRAPGDEILVLVPGGGFDYASGNSLSAGHVSGIVALLVASQPDLTGDDVNALLVASPTNAAGSVNACRALAQLLQRSGCRGDSAAKRSL